MEKFSYVLIFSFFLSCSACLEAASVTVIKAPDGTDRVCLENDLIHLEIDPNKGARGDDLKFKPWGDMEILPKKTAQWLFADMFWQEAWPGQFLESKYDYQILSNGPTEASVKFSRLSVNKGIPQIAGILLEKTITLKDGDRAIHTDIRLTNTTSEGKYLGYWEQNVGWLGGDKTGDFYFRPSKGGVDQASSDIADAPNGGFLRDPQAGWMAALDQKTQTGLVFLMDYNYLWFFYNCTGANTMEWQYDAVAIPPGKSWQTSMALVPVSQLGALNYASDKLLANVSFKEDPANNQLEITETYMAAARPLTSLEVQTGVELLQSHLKEEGAKTESISNLAFEPQSVTVAVPYDAKKREPVVARIAWTGKTEKGEPFSSKAEFWYQGSSSSNRDPVNGEPLYAIPSPKKEKEAIRPDRIERIVKDKPQVLFLKGLLSPDFRVEDAIHKLNPSAQIKEGYVYTGVFGSQLDYFPFDYNALMSYDLIVLGDVNATTLGDAVMEMLKDYCQHGGNLLVLPGPFAYGDGGYQGTAMDALLPVEGLREFDLQPSSGAMRAAFPGESMKPEKPDYVQEIKAKADAKVLISCGKTPLLVRGQYGSGTIYCVAATPMGGHNIWDEPEWQNVLKIVLGDLGLKRAAP